MMVNKKIVRVLILLSVMFLSLIGYLTYIQLFKSEKLASNPYNQRQWDDENGTLRGNIYDKNNVLLANTSDGERKYPYKNMYAHIIGYNSKTYGRINIESTYNDQLLGKNSFANIIGTGREKQGYDLHLTVDHDIQSAAYNALGNNNGCVIALNPKTGEIIAMVSKPDFDPNNEQLAGRWTELTENEESPFLARATSGLYTPGSTFKIITSLCAIENGYGNKEFEDSGSVKIGASVFENQKNKSYGLINITRGFAVSSNVVFCTLGAELGGEKLRKTAENFGFNKNFDFDISHNLSSFPVDEDNIEKSAALGIGQGEIQSTPLQMAIVTCGIANDGKIMKPYIVDEVTDKNGNVIEKMSPKVLYYCASKANTEKVKDMMVETVKTGTGTNASVYGISVAGKTGTAENELSSILNDKEHTWFVGFAPADNPQIAIVVMMEYSGGTGGGNCAPIARNIIQKYLSKNNR